MSRRDNGASNKWVIGQTAKITDTYRIGQKIGTPGQFGYAVKATHIPSHETRAIKVVSKARFRQVEERTFHFAQLRAEIEIMKRMNHKNIIKFHEVFENESDLYIVMELCTGGELFDRIKAAGHYSEAGAAAILRQMVEAIAYMHSQKIAHCDLKPDNFLFLNDRADAPIKIIDFGMAKFVKRHKYFKSLCGTPYYVAPEVILGQYNHHADMWSLGVVMFVMLFGFPPFYAEQDGAESDEAIFQQVLKGFTPVTKPGYDAHFPESIPCSESAKDLIAKLLTLDVAQRLTAEEALQHPWLKGETASDHPINDQVLKNLKTMDSRAQLKQAVLHLMSDSLTDNEIGELRKTFESIDENGDGIITVDELFKAMKNLGQDAKMEEVVQMIAHADANKDGNLSYEELLHVTVQRKLLAKEERLWQTFCRLDIDGDGRITREEISKVLGENDEEALQLIKEADANGDGIIDWMEFLQIWSDKQGN